MPKSIKSPVEFSFFGAPSVPVEISEMMKFSTWGKSLGPSSNPSKLLKLCTQICSQSFQVINKFSQYGIFLTRWSLVRLSLSSKKDMHSALNSRCLSLLSVFGKIIKKAVYKCFCNFLKFTFVVTALIVFHIACCHCLISYSIKNCAITN